MKIALFSGSFDPIHTGHAMVANYISQYCGIDQVWLMPSPLNPLKAGTKPADEEDRLEMCRIIAGKCTGVEVSDFEFSLPRPSFTYRTLSLLKDKFPEHSFFPVIGSDNWLLFDKWKNHAEIIKEFEILIYPRPGFDIQSELPSTVRLLKDAPQVLLSSTFIRKGLREGKNMNFFLDPEVMAYIKNHSLYE
ncbi:MAG: nicotinate-nucleotide adenylyltransferase [Muribaculaceae bacterium]|nr:nicotinate-nucleotide adenylyltransferase [Muribaculaceae bacterium]